VTYPLDSDLLPIRRWLTH